MVVMPRGRRLCENLAEGTGVSCTAGLPCQGRRRGCEHVAERAGVSSTCGGGRASVGSPVPPACSAVHWLRDPGRLAQSGRQADCAAESARSHPRAPARHRPVCRNRRGKAWLDDSPVEHGSCASLLLCQRSRPTERARQTRRGARNAHKTEDARYRSGQTRWSTRHGVGATRDGLGERAGGPRDQWSPVMRALAEAGACGTISGPGVLTNGRILMQERNGFVA